MSAKIMGQVYDLDLPANEQAVLLALADHADHEGNEVRPSNGLVAWKLGMSEDTVCRMKRKLVERGILVVVSEEIGQAKEYRIDLSKGTKKAPYQRRSNLNNPPQSAAPRNLRPPAELCGTHPPQSFAAPPPAELCGTNRKKEPSEEPCNRADAPSTKLQKPEAKPQEASPSQAAASQAQEAYALWIGRYNEAHPGEPYFNGTAKRRKADLAAMRALVDSGRTPEQIGETARRMFAAAKQSVNGKRAWWSEHCKSAFNFCERWTEITGELGQIAGVPSGTSTASAASEDRFLRRWTRDQGPVREQFRDDSSFRAHHQAWQQWAEAKA